MVRGLQVVVNEPSCKRFGHKLPENVRPVTLDGLADTREQVMVISSALAQRLGVKVNEMIPTSMNIMTANGNSMDILGGIWIKMIRSFKGNVMESHQLAYIAAGAKQFFVCRMALCDLDLIPKVWPPEGSNNMTPLTKGVPMADENIGDSGCG